MPELHYKLQLGKLGTQDYQHICKTAAKKLRDSGAATESEIVEVESRNCSRISLAAASAILDSASITQRGQLGFEPIVDQPTGWFDSVWSVGREKLFANAKVINMQSPLLQISWAGSNPQILEFLSEGAKLRFDVDAENFVDPKKFVLVIPNDNAVSTFRASKFVWGSANPKVRIEYSESHEHVWFDPCVPRVVSRSVDYKNWHECNKVDGIVDLLGASWKNDFSGGGTVMGTTANFLLEVYGKTFRDLQGTSLAVGAHMFAPAMLEWKRCFAETNSVSIHSDAMLSLVRLLAIFVRAENDGFDLKVCTNFLDDLGLENVQLTDDHKQVTLTGLDVAQQLATRMIFPPSRIRVRSVFTLDHSPLGSEVELLA